MKVHIDFSLFTADESIGVISGDLELELVPRTGDTQFFLYDPDGVGVELNFPKS